MQRQRISLHVVTDEHLEEKAHLRELRADLAWLTFVAGVAFLAWVLL